MQKTVLLLFWKQTWQFKKDVLGIAFLLPPTLLMHQFLPPLVMAEILNRLSSGNYIHGDLWGSFGWLLILFIFFRFISATFLWRAIIILAGRLESKVVQAFDRRIFSHILAQSASFHANRFGGSLVAAAGRFTGAYARLADSIVKQFSGLILSFLFAVIILWPRAPLYIVVLLLLSVVYIIVTFVVTHRVRQKTTAEASAFTAQTGALADSVTNVMAIKTFAAEAYEERRFRKTTYKTQKKFLEMLHATQKSELYFSSVTATITSVSMVLAVASVVVFNADIATTFLIIEYTGLLTARLWEFTNGTLKTYNRSIGDATEMTKLLMRSPTVKDIARPQVLEVSKGTILFKDVKFRHSNAEKLIFSKLNLEVAAGEKLGLVGHSGTGKSTLTKLLLRFADIDGGVISIDGQDITKVAQADLRKHIAYVPQEPLLFHRSIAENIWYGRPSATRQEVIAAARQAVAHEFIQALPKGYDTLVGERGVKLSGGQRQRIAIARAILKDAPILVLDEATSALDSESEKDIQLALTNLMKHKTAIVIAHRLSTIQRMDRIVVLDRGVVTESGTHDELLAQGGIYASLWQHQSGGFITE